MAEQDINLELTALAEKIKNYSRPEELFGSLEGENPIKLGSAIFRQLSRVLHPDRYPNPAENAVAEESFKRLSSLWSMAQAKLKNGTYGASEVDFDPITIKTPRNEYELRSLIYSGEITNIYLCRFDSQPKDMEAYFKVAKDPADNDLVASEADMLRGLSKSDGFGKFSYYFPQLVDSIRYRDSLESTPRQANVVTMAEGLRSLEEVKREYPAGIHPKDMAWMWRRLLVAEGFYHQQGIVNGAILPSNIFIQPEKHGLVVSEFSYAVLDPGNRGEYIKAISSDYEAWYPKQILDKVSPTEAVDISMGARCMIYLLGGDPVSGRLSPSTEPELQTYFKNLLLPSYPVRHHSAWELMENFDELIVSLWGPRKFRPFPMPTKKYTERR